MIQRDDWKKYFVFKTIEKNRTDGLCILCHRHYKDMRGISSNFLKHLKRKHSIEYERLHINTNQVSSDETSVQDGQTRTGDPSISQTKQNLINSSIGKNLIVKCNMPVNLVENVAFRNFLQDCGVKWKPISNKTLKNNVLHTFVNNVTNKIHDTLSDIDHLTLTIDGWSDRRCRSFLGFTCHFIDKQMEPRSLLIDFIRLKSPHTAERIHQLTESVLDKFNVKEKVYKIVTDNAATMVKAFQFGLNVAAEANPMNTSVDVDSKSVAMAEDNDGELTISYHIPRIEYF